MKAATIAAHPEIASIIVRLMMSINDLTLANNSIIEWHEATERKKVGRKAGAELYFVRILMGHVYEALKMIKAVSKYQPFRDAVMNCDQQTIDGFLRIESFAFSPEMATLEEFRNKASFHYDRNLPRENLKATVEELPDMHFACSMGDDGLDWHFALADALMARMLIRDIYQQGPKSPERRKKVEEIAMREQEIARVFTDFAGHFIRHYSK